MGKEKFILVKNPIKDIMCYNQVYIIKCH